MTDDNASTPRQYTYIDVATAKAGDYRRTYEDESLGAVERTDAFAAYWSAILDEKKRLDISDLDAMLEYRDWRWEIESTLIFAIKKGWLSTAAVARTQSEFADAPNVMRALECAVALADPTLSWHDILEIALDREVHWAAFAAVERIPDADLEEGVALIEASGQLRKLSRGLRGRMEVRDRISARSARL